ncbi:MAG: hypothetical protein ABFE07_15650, partial [Armatimonadia bacterium]
VAREVDAVLGFDPNDLFGPTFLDLVIGEIETHLIVQEQSGYMSMDQQRQVGVFIRSYFTTLKVRKRWDADAVLNLSGFLVKGLCGIFDAPKGLVDVVHRFIDMEEILYTIPRYRDHFFHQLKVFLLGFCLINQLNRAGKLRDSALSGPDGMRLWFLTSAFHDIGYPFQMMSTWLDGFIGGVLRTPEPRAVSAHRRRAEPPYLPTSLHWGALLAKDYHLWHFQCIVNRLCQSYEGIWERDDLPKIAPRLAPCVAVDPDHGIYSSLILQNFLRTNLSDEHTDLVACAVALHNDRVAELLHVTTGAKLCFARDPLSFLLSYCDLAQDWGRARLLSPRTKDTEQFGDNVFDNGSSPSTGAGGPEVLLLQGNTVTVDLRYCRDFAPGEVDEWREEMYDKRIEPLTKYWAASSGLDFCIRYFHGQTTAGRKALSELVF